jgi:hypothetical protein
MNDLGPFDHISIISDHGWPEFRRQNIQSKKFSIDFSPIDLDVNQFGLSIVSTKPTLT